MTRMLSHFLFFLLIASQVSAEHEYYDFDEINKIEENDINDLVDGDEIDEDVSHHKALFKHYSANVPDSNQAMVSLKVRDGKRFLDQDVLKNGVSVIDGT